MRCVEAQPHNVHPRCVACNVLAPVGVASAGTLASWLELAHTVLLLSEHMRVPPWSQPNLQDTMFFDSWPPQVGYQFATQPVSTPVAGQALCEAVRQILGMVVACVARVRAML